MENSGVKEIQPKDVLNYVSEDPKMRNIIDVREYEEVEQGKIPAANHIPLGELENRLHEIDKEKEHILVCRSGNRSGMAARFLKSRGYKVKNMVGGMLEWKDEIEK
ncbi:rhodanese-like domain-containing protein [Bacillaceae bacterium S4-13-56]